jgi:hypothetical protein
VAPLAVFSPDAPVSLRKKKEAWWIRRLKPRLNVKLVQKDEPRSRTSSVSSLASLGSPPVSPALRRKLGIAPATTRKKQKWCTCSVCLSFYLSVYLSLSYYVVSFTAVFARTWSRPVHSALREIFLWIQSLRIWVQPFV